MALINCPECNKEVSDKASACIHCGYPLQEQKNNEVDENSYDCRIDGSRYALYPVYGLVSSGKYRDAMMRMMSGVDKTVSVGNKYNLLQYMIENKSVPNEFSSINYSTDEENEFYQKAMSMKNDICSNGVINCPKCGSTQIQAVPRKWSLIAGLLTNNVDRVCLNCKNKF